MNSADVIKLARKSKRVRRSIWAHGSRLSHYWIKLLESVPADGGDVYMKWPGERLPRPWSGGPHRDVQEEDWELAA